MGKATVAFACTARRTPPPYAPLRNRLREGDAIIESRRSNTAELIRSPAARKTAPHFDTSILGRLLFKRAVIALLGSPSASGMIEKLR